MLFNSMQFVLFFIVVVLLYFTLPHKYRWILLLVASYYFYMCWKVKYIVLLLVTTLIDYFCAFRMSKYDDRKKRRRFLYLSLISNFTVLFTFKYFNFFTHSFNSLFGLFHIPWQIPFIHVLLPVGISFYTFQSVAYVLEVYWGRWKAERRLNIFGVYTSFFPQLVAGPIERPYHLLPQLEEEQRFDGARIASGLRLMLWGFFKKLVVADRLALYVNAVYNNADLHSGFSLLIATYFFAFQIYCDFSGYTDIAIGAARVLGINLMRNFNRPYFSLSIPEFWRRWHISLSSWFRDYVYIPLGGNRISVPRMYLNLFLVFLVSGLWHGANWTFVIWGSLHGLYAVASKLSLPSRDRVIKKWNIPLGIVKSSRMFLTFHLVCLSWIYFRAESLAKANSIVAKIVTLDGVSLFVPAMDQFVYGIIGIAILLLVDAFQEKTSIAVKLDAQPLAIRWGAYIAATVIILLIGVFNGSQFIYFQF